MTGLEAAHRLAHIAAAYDWTLPTGAKPMGKNTRLQQIIVDTLAKGVGEGDVCPSIAPQEFVSLHNLVILCPFRHSGRCP